MRRRDQGRCVNGECLSLLSLSPPPADTVRDTFFVDPAVILIVVGVVMFFITFCGCIGALRENIRLLKMVTLESRPQIRL